MTTPHRCDWVNLKDPLYVKYHDEEWGVPVHTESGLFERLCLEAAEAGLSWIVILRKRENYRAAFDQFDPTKVARYDDAKIATLLQNEGIVRSRAKIEAAVHNAARFLEVAAEFGTFNAYLWDYVGGKPIQNEWPTIADVPTETALSQKMSKDLKKRGFKFVGPTICYSTMQAAGLVNDHIVECFRHAEVKAKSDT